jgi:tetratricopeptide (TPR) repeat protein
LPTSASVIGKLVDLLQVDDEFLSGRTAARYYSSTPVKDGTALQIHIAIGEVLVGRGIVPVPEVFQQRGISMANIIAISIGYAASRWDHLGAWLESESVPIYHTPEAAKRFMRLVVVDLALRGFALLRLSHIRPPQPRVPEWATENGEGKVLRRYLKQARITREKFASDLKVSDTAVDNWLGGKNPVSRVDLEQIVELVTDQLAGEDSHRIRAQLFREILLSRVATALAVHVGREYVEDLAFTLIRFIRDISADVETMNRPPIETALGAEWDALIRGTLDPNSNVLLRNLAIAEKDPAWRRDILDATSDWSVAFQYLTVGGTWPKAAAGVAQEFPTTTDLEDADSASSAKAEFRSLIAGITMRWIPERPPDPRIFDSSLHSTVDSCRAIVLRHQTDAYAHSQAGSLLGLIAEYLNDRDLVTEAINECKIAAELKPGWDVPLVEPGIILANVGRYEEAERDLLAAAARLPASTPHLSFALGYVRMCRGEFDKALADFEQALTTRPDYALALAYAGHCAFKAGMSVKGRKLAKRARSLGETWVYSSWRTGRYKRA